MGLQRGFPAGWGLATGLGVRLISPSSSPSKGVATPNSSPGKALAARSAVRKGLFRSGVLLLVALAAALLLSEALGLPWVKFARQPARAAGHARGRRPLQEPSPGVLEPRERAPGAAGASAPAASDSLHASAGGTQAPAGAGSREPRGSGADLGRASLAPQRGSGTPGSPPPSVDRPVAGGAMATATAREPADSWQQSTPQGNRGSAFRYEKAGMAWSPQGVKYRGASWRREVGAWMQQCHGRAEPVQVEEAFFSKACPAGCSGNGTCDFLTGKCRCRKGFTGRACTRTQDFPCNLPAEPRWPLGPKINTMCAAQCNRRVSQCFCGEGTPFPNRPVIAPCGFQKLQNGEVNFSAIAPERLFSKDPEDIGWCMLDPEKYHKGQHKMSPHHFCPIRYDGVSGVFGETPTTAVCFNQCTGPEFGTCDGSFCKCRKGWGGTDCSTPAASAMRPLPTPLPPWLAPTGIQEQPDAILDSGGRLLLKRKQKRPLIYVYDPPRKFTSGLIEGRVSQFHCMTRVFLSDNSSINNDPWLYGAEVSRRINNDPWLYGAEMMIYESMLVSPHRTNNPEEADYFFVPFLTSCLMLQADDSPAYVMRTETPENRVRPNWLIDWVLELLQALRTDYPYWDRNQGRDHIWMFMWDEGSCHVPDAIRSSIILSHWGNTESDHKGCQTAWCGDVCTLIPQWKLGNHTCYDPAKDIVVPPRKTPSFLKKELRQRTYEERPTLFFHRGNMGAAFMFGRPEETYSMRIRQKVAYYFSSTPDKNGSLGVLSEPGVKVEHGDNSNYMEELSSSKFCGVFPGDGFSARPSDSILQGCIPVIIQDGIEKPFENFLDYESFAVRIREEDIPDMVKILKSIPEARVRKMLETVQSILSRWFFRLPLEMQARREEAAIKRRPQWKPEVEQIRGDDAFDTIIQILHYKLYNDPWRQMGKSRARESSGLAEGCLRS